MAWDILLFGSLSVPHDAVESWLTTPVSPAEFSGWPDLFAGGLSPQAPEVLAEQLRSLCLEPHEFLQLEQAEPGEWSVRGMLGKDAFIESHLQLALLWRSAAAHQGRGALQLFGERTLSFGYRIEVEAGRSTFEALSSPARSKARKSPQARAVDAHAQTNLRSLLGAPAHRIAKSPFTAL